MSKIAAVVVLYNPGWDVYINILTYLNQVCKVYVIDNSDLAVNNNLIDSIIQTQNVDYYKLESNPGIPYALNLGAKKAISEGFEYLLTMDQDGKASENMVDTLFAIMGTSENIGIVASEHVNLNYQTIPLMKETNEVTYTMTSGNLLNLKAYEKTGEFLEELFIDHVDHEYCLRLKANNYKIIATSSTYILHELGNSKKKKFFHTYLFPTFHSPIRYYYRTRNRLYVDNLYKTRFPEYVKEDRKNMFREFLSIFLYEDKLWPKARMIVKGYIHYRSKKMGKYINV